MCVCLCVLCIFYYTVWVVSPSTATVSLKRHLIAIPGAGTTAEFHLLLGLLFGTQLQFATSLCGQRETWAGIAGCDDFGSCLLYITCCGCGCCSCCCSGWACVKVYLMLLCCWLLLLLLSDYFILWRWLRGCCNSAAIAYHLVDATGCSL